MDAFEEIVGLFLQEEGYWVRHSVKVDITKADKVEMGLPSMPRPEIDIVAFNSRQNELLLVEVKSFFDSPGVRYASVCGERDLGRYRLLTDKTFQRIVSTKLKEHYVDKGLVVKTTKVNYGLAAGKIYSTDEGKLTTLFNQNGWRLFTPSKIRDRIKALSEKSWENNVATLITKILLRGSTE